jgi:hypothetical protein
MSRVATKPKTTNCPGGERSETECPGRGAKFFFFKFFLGEDEFIKGSMFLFFIFYFFLQDEFFWMRIFFAHKEDFSSQD